MRHRSMVFVASFSLVLFFSCKKSGQQEGQQKSGEQIQAEAAKDSARQGAHTETEVKATSGQPESTTSNQPAQEQLIPLDIKLPKPMFVGTPTNIAVPNLEKPLGRPRPPFLVPAGTTNVAFRKPVTSSDEQPVIGELSLITDGDKEASEGSFVELGPKLQFVTIDLKKECAIYAIVVWHYHKQAVVYHDVIIQVADDQDFISNVQTVFNNDIDNSAGRGVGKDMSYVETAEGKLVDAKGVHGRYVRLYSRGNTSNELNHYIEVEVYGKAVQ